MLCGNHATPRLAPSDAVVPRAVKSNGRVSWPRSTAALVRAQASGLRESRVVRCRGKSTGMRPWNPCAVAECPGTWPPRVRHVALGFHATVASAGQIQLFFRDGFDQHQTHIGGLDRRLESRNACEEIDQLTGRFLAAIGQSPRREEREVFASNDRDLGFTGPRPRTVAMPANSVLRMSTAAPPSRWQLSTPFLLSLRWHSNGHSRRSLSE